MHALTTGVGMHTGPEGIWLAHFFERTFAPHQLQAAPRRAAEFHREAINWLSRYLGRSATLADVNAANLWELQGYLARRGCKPKTIKRVRLKLTALGKHAWRMGLLPCWEPIKRRAVKPRAVAFLNSPPPAGSLAAAFAELLAEQPDAESRRGLKKHTYGLGLFDRFLGRYSTPDDLTKETLAAFERRMIADRRSPCALRQYRTTLRRLARRIDPERFPDARRTVPDLPPPAPGSVREFFEAVYVPCRLIGATKQELQEFRRTLRRFYSHLGRELPIEELSDAIIGDFLTALLETGIASITVNGYRKHLLALWRLAVERGRHSTAPQIRKLTETLDTPDSWSEEEVQRIFDAPALIPWRRHVAGIPAAKFFRAFLLVAYWTALRRGTLLKLRRRDVNLATGWVNVPGKFMKNKRGKRFRLGPDAIAAVAEIWKPERELLFPWPHDNTHLDTAVNRIITTAGVPPSTRETLTGMHKMRRTVATITAVKRGIAAACELLGHSREEVTRRYIDPTKLAGQDATEFLPIITQSVQAAPSADAANAPRDPEAFLAEAKQLFQQGHLLAAAMTGRVALERWLQATARRLRLKPHHAKGVSDYAHLLHREAAIDETTHKQIRRYSETANRAAHGQTVSPQKVSELLNGLNDLFSIPLTKGEKSDV